MTTTSNSHGFFRRALNGFIAARQHEAELYVARRLLEMDDASLRARGLTRRDIQTRFDRLV